MIVTPLANEIQTFQMLLPELRQKYGSTWAVVVGDSLTGTFNDFNSAAEFAVKNFSSREFLIRHTDEAQVSIPYVAIED
jgi:hypothetical protein